MKIVVAEKIASSALNLLKQDPSWTVVSAEEIQGDLASELKGADALIVRSAVKVDAGLLEHAHGLRVIGRAGVGVDNVDLHAATKKGIAVMNTPGANAVAVAEQTVGMMIALARQLCQADRLMHEGKWEKKALQGTELRGKTLGIAGLGRIGMEVARRALAFGMTVIAYDPFVSPAVAEELGVRLETLDVVFAQADYLTLHVGLTPQTTGMINAASLAKMKKGVRLVNCARGELVDEAALSAALKSGQVAGAALDVFQNEPLKDSPLTAMNNVVLTPHIGGSTKEAQEAVGVQIAQQVVEYLTTGVFQNAVNVPSVSYEEYVEMQPYLVLAERLGAVAAQIADGNLHDVVLRYGGRIATWKTELVRNAAIMGVLHKAAQANIVNATSIAQARGIHIREAAAHKEAGGNPDVLTIKVNTSLQELVVRGTVLHGDSPRLLSVDLIDIEARLEPNLIFMRNQDVPGVVAHVGNTLARHGVNIADFSLGRAELGPYPREAAAVVRVDGSVPEKVLTELRSISAVKQAKAIYLPDGDHPPDEEADFGNGNGS
jgi:D-3-phosphoglycerate dehydrogenase